MEEFQRSLESSTRDIGGVLERLQKLNALWQIFVVLPRGKNKRTQKKTSAEKFCFLFFPWGPFEDE